MIVRAFCILLISAATTLAQSTQSGSTQSQTTQESSVASPTPPPVQTERACYIGVGTSPASPTLREQLRLPRNTGLVIDVVDPKSPAEVAGLQPHDVLLRFNDQLIVNIPQLSVLVRNQEPGTPCTFHILRQGQPIEVSIKPIERLMPVLEEARGNAPALLLPRPGKGRSCSVITHTDGDAVITLTSRENDRHLTVKQLNGTLVYDGPLNNADDEAKVPAGLQEKVRHVLSSTERFKDLLPR